jgi:predicted pyridoxine 5'-phosphate oxidase superfamily flavin-nucleotide-binding protein
MQLDSSTNGDGGCTVRLGSAGEHTLQSAYGTQERADRFYDQQVAGRLNAQMRDFIARMEMAFVATADAHGECDATFRAGPPGFVRVIESDTIAWPEYRGNGVMASLGNISENHHVGILFVDFVRDLVGLHVNGAATIAEADAFAEAFPEHVPVGDIPGRRPERWVVVEIAEAYIHCSKHVPRMIPVPRNRAWGTDDKRKKGGDAFGVAAERKAAAAAR